MRLDTTGARRTARALLLIGAVAAGGCATVADPLRANLGADDGKVAACAGWYHRLDAGIDAAAVRDGGAWRLPGFPYLRTDRHLASLRDTALASDGAFHAWVGRMADLDLDARSVEIRNLPEPALSRLQSGRDQALSRTRECSATLAAYDFATSDKQAMLAGRARVPDDYATWERALGLYAITRIPFSSGIDKWHRETVDSFRKAGEGTLEIGTTSRFAPAGSPDLQQARAIVSTAPRDALGLPEFTAAQRDVLFDAFAPVIEVETTGPFDHIGALAWGDGRAPVVDATRPLYYRKLAFTRNGGDTLVQLVYVAWFSERPKKNAFDLLGGSLDGILWRVTLDRSGEPLVYDTIHPCGCFHMFFPADGVEPVPPPQKLIEWAFVPAGAPALPDGGRMKILLRTRTHYMVSLGVVQGAGDGIQPVGFADYDDLRSMPAAGGTSRSMFAPDGLMPGTDRSERALFWPMGVPSAGAMRQWGRHSTAFLGRRHFDDADLMERRFSLPQH